MVLDHILLNPTSLSSSVLHEKITVTWTDAAAGSQVPKTRKIRFMAHLLVMIHPSEVVLNINHGVQHLQNMGNTGISKFFYTNTGSDIDYKTDGTFQTTNATTNAMQITEIVYLETIGNFYNPTNNHHTQYQIHQIIRLIQGTDGGNDFQYGMEENFYLKILHQILLMN